MSYGRIRFDKAQPKDGEDSCFAVPMSLRVCRKDSKRLSAHNIRSELSGIVLRIDTSVGDRVSEGDSLVVLVSMKMEIPMSAPFAGVVQSILVSEGSTVAEGETVLVISR
jgi:biotin carboxyl carrier protein